MMRHRIGRILKIVLMVAAGFALFSFFLMQLWNWLAPEVFGWHQITYWQALGLFVLSKILFGGFRGGWGHRGHWNRRMQERWEQMTPEQREQFRKGMAGWCTRSTIRSDVTATGTAGTPKA